MGDSEQEAKVTTYWRYPMDTEGKCPVCGRTYHTQFHREDGAKMCGACMQKDTVEGKKKVINGKPS